MASYIRAFKGLCQECEKYFSLAERFCTVVNLDINGFEKDKFEDGSLNRVCCPFCNTEFTFELPMIVFSMNMKFACLIEPNINITGINSLKAPPHILLPEGFKFRCVRYLEEAREKVRILKRGLDDVFIEYIKLISFNDEVALPFDERNIVFSSKNEDTYKFTQIDYNNKILQEFTIEFTDSNIPDAVINIKNSLSGKKWHKLDRISLKEELSCQNIKMSL